jgi:hypothetical protein
MILMSFPTRPQDTSLDSQAQMAEIRQDCMRLRQEQDAQQKSWLGQRIEMSWDVRGFTLWLCQNSY